MAVKSSAATETRAQRTPSVEALRSDQPEPKQTLGDIAVTRLRNDILSGRLAPESRLRFELLRALYGLNVGTLREGLSRLVAEGLVEGIGQKGFKVAPISARDLSDLTALRRHVDQLGLRLSIERGDLAWETRVVSSLYQMTRVPRRVDAGTSNPEWEANHTAFHRSLIAGANSPVLLQTHAMLFDRAERYRRLAFSNQLTIANTDSEHRSIMEATVARDTDRACLLLDKHIVRTCEKVLKLMAQRR